MTLDIVRERLYSLTALFFAGANVLWAEQVNTQAALPYVTIKIGGVRRGTHSVKYLALGSCYHCETVAEFNLYTAGKSIPVNGKATGNFINTATADLTQFANFMESPGAIDILSDPPISVILKGEIRDLSFLENDRKHRYRAMAEFDIGFVERADGRYGILGETVPNASGGGVNSMASEIIENIEEAEIEEII